MSLKFAYDIIWGQIILSGEYFLLRQSTPLCYKNPDIIFWEAVFLRNNLCLVSATQYKSQHHKKSYVLFGMLFSGQNHNKRIVASLFTDPRKYNFISKALQIILYHSSVSRRDLCQNTNNYTLSTVHKIMTKRTTK